jgi:hypothetical protein
MGKAWTTAHFSPAVHHYTETMLSTPPPYLGS